MICSNARRGVSRRLFSTASNSASKRSTDGYAWSNLYDEAYHMMMAAYVSYPLSFLLREAESGRFKHSKEFCQKLEMIHDGDISTALHPNDIVDLIQNNREYIEQHYTGKTGKTNLDDSFGWFRMLQQYSKMAGGDDPYNVSLLEFDDHHDEYRLAYGIGINKHLKRITLMFRGTYADGTSDWKRNLQATQIKVPLPPALLDEDSVADPNDTTNVCFFHQGCFEYLFRNCDRGPSYPQERYEEVLTNILAVLEQYPDYKVFIAGHSLGGALALLVSFYASADPRIPKPITCVSVGSLLIGDDHFRQAFEKSEALGWIRHLRITNDNDPVPYLPPFSWYRPVGMHLRLNQQEGFSISHATSSVLSSSSPPKENTMSSWRLFWNAFQSRLSLEKFVEPHNIPEYLRRMEREKEHLVGIHLNALYRDPNIVGKDFKTRL